MIEPRDLAACSDAIRAGSLSFHAASRLLPPQVRDPSLALYAFCRLADDAVDEAARPEGAVARLGRRLDAVYEGRPFDAPADRAFAAVVEATAMPRALPEALLEGLAWDAAGAWGGRGCETASDLKAYAARVAASVGAMMCVIMGVRDAHALARACDLGLAMQMTNVARDVGEDAGLGRLYLPRAWLDAEGVDAAALLADPRPSPGLTRVVGRLLDEAARLYARAGTGVALLPPAARPGIHAAALIYAGIGAAVVRGGCDPRIRARTTGAFKARALTLAVLHGAVGAATPRAPALRAPPEPEAAFLVDAAARRAAASPWGEGRAGALIGLLAQLEARDRALRGQV